MRFEMESAKQVMDDSAEEVRKIASELLEMHRISTLPYADMERDAVFSSNDPDAIKSASDLIANYISQKVSIFLVMTLVKPAPRIVRDKFFPRCLCLNRRRNTLVCIKLQKAI